MLIGMRNAMLADGGGWKNPYVTDGLIAMWDGEWNAGGGVHDAAATTWKNLTGDTAWDMAVPAAWQDKGLYFDGTWCGIAPKTSELSVTIEAVFDQVQSDSSISVGWSLQWDNKRYSFLSSGVTRVIRAYIGANAFDQTFKENARSISLAVGTTSSTFYVDGASPAISTSAVGVSGETRNHFRLGGYGTTSDTDAEGYYYYKGNIYRCSIYSRALTAAEIAANYAVDKARFNLA